MRLRANIRRATGNTRHTVHGRDAESAIAWVEIEAADTGYQLFYFSDAGECLADTWHASLADAKRQASFEFEIQEANWKAA